MTRCDEPPPPPRRGEGQRSFEEALERIASGVAPAPGAPAAADRAGIPSLPELREAVRAIPPAIWSGHLAGGSAVELAFGRELSIELREVSGGIALAVRAGEGVARAARVDLPALVEALRQRGVTVVRAEVRGCSHAGGATARRSASR